MPTYSHRLQGFAHYRDLVLHKAWADFRAEAERTYLGVAWWVLEPLINMGIYFLVFGLFLGQNRPGFLPHLLVGLVMWRFFDATVMRAAHSILGNMGLVRQIAFRKIIFPIIAVLTCGLEFLFSLGLLLVLIALAGYPPTTAWLAFPIELAVLALFTLAVSLPLAALTPFVPDLLKPVQYSLRILFYMSGIMYYVDALPPRVQWWLGWNPALQLIGAFRATLLHAQWPDPWPLLWVSAISCALLAIGVRLHGALDGVYAKRVTP